MILNTSKYVANELNAKLFKHLSQKVETSAVSISLFCFFQEDVNQVTLLEILTLFPGRKSSNLDNFEKIIYVTQIDKNHTFFRKLC